jgi:hypothetical protein
MAASCALVNGAVLHERTWRAAVEQFGAHGEADCSISSGCIA